MGEIKGSEQKNLHKVLTEYVEKNHNRFKSINAWSKKVASHGHKCGQALTNPCHAVKPVEGAEPPSNPPDPDNPPAPGVELKPLDKFDENAFNTDSMMPRYSHLCFNLSSKTNHLTLNFITKIRFKF